jgi:hypothetical protein
MSRLEIARSLMLAQADQELYGAVIDKSTSSYIAKFENRCDRCGHNLRIGENGTYGYRMYQGIWIQSDLSIHATCPVTYIINESRNLFEEYRWLREWKGDPLVSCVKPIRNGTCKKCRTLLSGQYGALVRKPGPLKKDNDELYTHSAWHCLGCAKVEHTLTPRTRG